MVDLKQEAFAFELVGDWTQKPISLLEQKEQIDKPVLQEVSEALKVLVEVIEKLDDEGAVNIFANTFSDSSGAIQNQCTFNPLDKMVELYERMLKEKDAMMARLEKLVEKSK
ncbi:MAG: XRE family transcriptional regulator [Solitalea-like symbiont of Tyrophagus putrescentiae]